MSDDLEDLSMFEIFRIEAENQTAVLNRGLLALERTPTAADEIEEVMRAAHSLKGAARIVGLDSGVRVAHAMEDCLVAAQNGQLTLDQARIDVLLRGVDLITRIAQTPEDALGQWDKGGGSEIDAFLAAVRGAAAPSAPAASPPTSEIPEPTPPPKALEPATPAAPRAGTARDDRVLRVSADSLDRLLALAGESLIESRRFKPFADSLLRLKRLQRQALRSLDAVNDTNAAMTEEARAVLQDGAHRQLLHCQEALAEQLEEFEEFDRRATNLSHRLYEEALAVRMRPLADGIQGFPRLVRDVSRDLGKQVKFEVTGETTAVDRDILEKLEAPLGHLLRNAIDHGVEAPADRLAAGKPAEALLRLEARHRAGTLQIIVSDDGRGIAADKLRAKIVARELTSAETAAEMTDAELWEFLFLPGFTMKEEVTEISGRGVGLDVVQTMVQQVRGTVRVSSERGVGTHFHLQLPLTLSVVRALLVEIDGEPYALPLAQVVRTLKLAPERVRQLEGRAHFDFEGEQIGLVAAAQVLGQGAAAPANAELAVVVVGGHRGTYAMIVDRFIGDRELVVQPLDARLGKVKDVAAAALMEDGSPVLIADVEDMVRSIEKLVTEGRLDLVRRESAAGAAGRAQKRILVVDDSLTVRELERKLLAGRGFVVEVAVDGMDGWNAVRTGNFDLVITDVDMPRMDGIELVGLIKKDPHLQSLPVMIISYKDRESDRLRGLEAGADYYLTKGSFHDESMVQTVVDLIGEPAA